MGDGMKLPRVPLLAAPARLVRLVARQRRKSHRGAAAQTVYEGERHTTLISLAGSMRRRGATESEILSALQTANTERIIPPLSDKEINGIAHDIATKDPDDSE